MSFSALIIRCLRQIDLGNENGKQSQVTIIKITESKENKSIQRLDVVGLNRSSWGSYPLAPPSPPATYGYAPVTFKELFYTLNTKPSVKMLRPKNPFSDVVFFNFIVYS